MAGEGIVGILRVILGMDTSQYEDGAKRAAKATDAFGKSMLSVFSGVGLERIVSQTFSAIAHTFKKSITDAFEFADNMGKMAQKVGITVEELTSLKVAADLSDVSMEALSAGLGKLSRSMVEAASKGGEARSQFKALGIDVRDSSGNIKSVTQVLVEMADKFAGSADGATKVAAAMKLLGKGGKELIPLLNEGGQSLKEFADLAKNMGLVISQNTANQTQKFNDDLKILSFSLQGVANLVIKDLIPGFVRMSGTLVNSAKSGDGIRMMADLIVSSFKRMFGSFIILIEANDLLGQSFNAMFEAVQLSIDGVVEVFFKAIEPIRKMMNFIIDAITSPWRKLGVVFQSVGTVIIEKIGGAIEWVRSKLPAATDDTNEIVKAFQDWQATLTSGKFDQASALFEVMRAKIEELKKVSPEAASLVEKLFAAFDQGGRKITGAIEAPNKELQKFTQELQKIALQTREVSGEFSGKLAPGFIAAAQSLKLINEDGSNLEKILSLNDEKARKLNDALFRLSAFKLSEEFIAPWELWRRKLEEINAEIAKTPEKTEVLKAATVKATAEMAHSMGVYAQSIVGPVADAFKTMAGLNKKYAGIAKAAAIGEAIVATYLAATKALASTAPWPLPLAFAAAATAAGLANVAKISATEFQTGGSFKVGGAGGVDSQLVSFKASPGEMVDVRRPDSRRGGAGMVQTIELRSPNPRDFFAQHVRELVETLNAAAPDGYIIKVA